MSVRVRRALAEGDLPRLQEALADWGADAGRLTYCHVGDLAHRIESELRGRATELVDVWEQDGALNAMTISGRFGTTFDAWVAPAHRHELEREVLERAATRTAAMGDHDFVETDVVETDHHRVELLIALGFERHRIWDHVAEVDLAAAVGPFAAAPDGVVIRWAAPGDAALVAASAAVFPSAGPPAGPTLVAAVPDGRVSAFAGVWLDEANRVGLFEPVGTAAEWRRMGRARAVMAAGLDAMRRAGMATARVQHDVTNEAAAALYRSLGFHRVATTHGYRRRVVP